MATYEGMGLCEKSEYQTAFESRLTSEQLTRGELYVARFLIDDYPKACRILGRVSLILAAKGQSHTVRFHMLDNDMKMLDVGDVGQMKNGLWNPYEATDFIAPSGAVYGQLRDGCMGEFEEDDGFGGELRTYLDLQLMDSLDRQLTQV